MRLWGYRIACLVGPEFEDLEFWVPLMRMREEGGETVIIGLHAGETYHGKHGLTAVADMAARDAKPGDYAALLIPGGWAPDKLRRDEGVLQLVRDIDAAGKPIGMLCHAGLVGISAGIVRGQQATGSLGIKDDLINAGATWRDVPAFRSGHLVWGRVVDDIPEYCREMIAALTA